MQRINEPLELRSFWTKLFPHSLILVGFLFVFLSAFRVYGYFASDLFRGPPVMLGFILMWLVPFAFLTAYGREQIGIKTPRSIIWILLAILGGSAFALLCYFLGLVLYGKTEQNWFASIGYTFQSDGRLAAMPRNIAFIAFTIPAMIASPIGEEFFFRGLTQEAGKDRLSPNARACLAAGLFALAHLAHHGIYRNHTGIQFMPVSGAIWFSLMFSASLVFTYFRQKGDSIWTAVVAHSAFNLTMNVTIFYSLLVTEPRISV